jgi:hypothetical protein
MCFTWCFTYVLHGVLHMFYMVLYMCFTSLLHGVLQCQVFVLGYPVELTQNPRWDTGNPRRIIDKFKS